jgi:acyl carrier protein
MSETIKQVQDLLRNVFDDDELTIEPATTSADIDGWDSMMHINVIIAVERKFGVRFAAAESNAIKEPGQNLGTFCALVDRKLAAKA